MITVKVIEDSTCAAGVRLATLQLCYPRFVHAEFMTHRVFSRNASSSRAIPVKRMLEMVRNEPAMPVHWGANQPGMQARDELKGRYLDRAKELWLSAANCAAGIAEEMQDLGLHKQVANRILEPFQHISVVLTATEWDNFFALRDHPDADPNIQALAAEMGYAMCKSEPTMLEVGDWHLPYVSREERRNLSIEVQLKVSAARCARVSYLNHDGSHPDIEKDIDLHDKLVGANPPHMSPVEHQARCRGLSTGWSGNFRSWEQYRKLLEDRA